MLHTSSDHHSTQVEATGSGPRVAGSHHHEPTTFCTRHETQREGRKPQLRIHFMTVGDCDRRQVVRGSGSVGGHPFVSKEHPGNPQKRPQQCTPPRNRWAWVQATSSPQQSEESKYPLPPGSSPDINPARYLASDRWQLIASALANYYTPAAAFRTQIATGTRANTDTCLSCFSER